MRFKWLLFPVLFASVLLAAHGGEQPNDFAKAFKEARADAQPKDAPAPKAAAFPRGLTKTPRDKILRHAIKHPFVAAANVQLPASVSYVPAKLSFWGNNQYGDCVSAEEAFNQACLNPEVFITDATVKGWAAKYGFLNGANLGEVMDQMRQKGFQQDGNTYGVGPYLSVDYGTEATLQAALTVAPVKIGIDAGALPGGAGGRNGWYTHGRGNYHDENHCVSLAGYGPPASMFAALGVDAVPGDWPASSKTAYLLFTWNTIGVVDHDWLLGTCSEAYVRNPTATKNGQPQPNPGPGPNPAPPVPPTPVPPGPNPVPPAPPGGSYTLTYTYTADGKLVGPPVVNAAPAPSGGLEAELKGAGVSPEIIADVLALVADIKAKKGLPAIMADLLRIIADLK